MNQDLVELAGAIVVHEGRIRRILIVRRSVKEGFLPGRWGVPCGKVDVGESPEDAVLRELREETGLDGDVIRQVGNTHFTSHRNGREFRNRQTNYLVRPLTAWDKGGRAPGAPEAGDGDPPAVSPPEDDQAWKWVAANEIDEEDLDPYNRQVIHQGLVSLRASQPPG